MITYYCQNMEEALITALEIKYCGHVKSVIKRRLFLCLVSFDVLFPIRPEKPRLIINVLLDLYVCVVIFAIGGH